MNNKFQKFMYGRYGVIDELYKFLLYESVVLLIINIFIKNSILELIILLIFIYMIYRYLSKKIYVRSNENRRFIKIKNKLLNPFINIKRNIKNKDYIYKKCPKCKTTLKLPLPNKRGFKKAKCPKCGKRVRLFTLKKLKVEIIKGGGHIDRNKNN